MPEMPNSGKQHGQPEPVGGGDYFGIALRTAGLNDGGGSGSGNFFHAIGERKERVGGGNRALERQLRFHRANLGRIHAAHLTGSYADGLAVARIHDGVGLDVFAHLPGEEQCAGFFGRRGRVWSRL